MCAAPTWASTDTARKAAPSSFFCSLYKNLLPVWEHESCFISKGVNPARDCFPLMRPLNFPLATIFEVVENLNRIPLPGWSCLCWDLLQEVKKGIAEICECPCTWWLKSRCVVATGELFSFIDVLVLKVRWRGRGIICLL